MAALQELLGAYQEEEYSVAAEKCNFLLKKKGSADATLTSSIQRLLLQSYLHLQDYNKVMDWCTQYNLHKDLNLYAQYRLEKFDSIAKQATSSCDGSAMLLEQHLLAQSQFHLKQVTRALKVYQELLLQNNDGQETRMELYTNALAVLLSTATPFVSLGNNNVWLEQAESFLEAHQEYSDLALNLGTLQFLTQPAHDKNWLEHAQQHCDDIDDLIPIDLNVVWSRHFWADDLEDIHYNTEAGTAPQVAVAKLNQCLLSVNGEKQQSIPTQPNPKWNSLQLCMYWYNRAVTQYKSSKWVECQESCQSLRKTLAGGGKQKKQNVKQTPAELWWECRVDVVLARVMMQQSKTTSAIAKLEQRLEYLQNNNEQSSAIMDHAIAYVQLHLHSLKHPSPSSQKKEELLKSLPASIRSRPAAVATRKVLEENAPKHQQQAATTSSPDALFAQGKYEQAADLYQQQLPDPAKCNPDQLTRHLKLVQCLAATDRYDQASGLWRSLQSYLEGSVDASVEGGGEALEQQALPRSSTSITTTAVQDLSSSKPKRSHEGVLRQRARKREAYLKDLEKKGQYNPDRPSQPNVERWVPKHERSRARGRGRHQNNRSAQGGSSQADSQRLDAAARRAGTVPASTGPSTANLKVSSGGRKGGRRR